MAGVQHPGAKRISGADAADNLAFAQAPRGLPARVTAVFQPVRPFGAVDHHPSPHAGLQQLLRGLRHQMLLQSALGRSQRQPGKLAGLQLVDHQIIQPAQRRQNQRPVARIALSRYQI
ncbi:hypothetical protein D3C79_955700 [compost metagenome]